MEQNESRPYAFTGHFSTFRGRIVSDILLCSPDSGNPNSVHVRAMWDTGCSQSIVSRRVAEFLSLRSNGQLTFRSPFGGSRVCSLAETCICIVLGGARVNITVGIADDPCPDLDCDVVLGLDFITLGDFALTHDDEQIVLSFCYPPAGAPIDYSILTPRCSNEPVVIESCTIDESNAVESRRRGLIMLDYYEETASAIRKRKEQHYGRADKPE